MAGGGARRGTLVIHYGTGHRCPAPRPRQPQDGTRSCGSQPAHQSMLDRRPQHRPLPCAILSLVLTAEPIGRRTLMTNALEKGHESGQMQTEDSLCPDAALATVALRCNMLLRRERIGSFAALWQAIGDLVPRYPGLDVPVD